jgi:hypothetical protein
MALWFQETVAAVSMLMFVGSVLVLAVAGQALLV